MLWLMDQPLPFVQTLTNITNHGIFRSFQSVYTYFNNFNTASMNSDIAKYARNTGTVSITATFLCTYLVSTGYITGLGTLEVTEARLSGHTNATLSIASLTIDGLLVNTATLTAKELCSGHLLSYGSTYLSSDSISVVTNVVLDNYNFTSLDGSILCNNTIVYNRPDAIMVMQNLSISGANVYNYGHVNTYNSCTLHTFSTTIWSQSAVENCSGKAE